MERDHRHRQSAGEGAAERRKEKDEEEEEESLCTVCQIVAYLNGRCLIDEEDRALVRLHMKLKHGSRSRFIQN